jgi:IS5 family transposase
MSGTSSAAEGEKGWPALYLLKALMLARWYKLSYVKLAEVLDDRASFHRFCGFFRTEATPERTAFVWFRRELVRRGLADALFETVITQLLARQVTLKIGTLIDGTIIASDTNTDLVQKVLVTAANVNDGRTGCHVEPNDPGDVFAFGGRVRVVATHVWARSEAGEACKLNAINSPIHKVGGRIENIFRTPAFAGAGSGSALGVCEKCLT